MLRHWHTLLRTMPAGVFAAVLVCALTPATAAGHETPAQSMEAACRSLVLDYAYYRDRYDAEGYANLFAEDATLSVLGVDYVGRAAIKERMLNDAAKPVSHHHMSTIKIIPVDATTATGVSYVTVYVEPASDRLPVTTRGFTALGEYHDRFVKTADGWKIARREFKPALIPGEEMPEGQ